MTATRIGNGQAGIATTEFALIAPTLLIMIFGFIEFAWVASARAALESATMRGARLIAASDCPANREGLLRQTITKQMSFVRSSDGLPPTIETRSYDAEYGKVFIPEPFVDDKDPAKQEPTDNNQKYDEGEPYTDTNGNGKYDTDLHAEEGSIGAAGEVTSYTTKYKVKSLIPWIAKRFNDGNDYYPIQAVTVIRNEPVFRDTGC